jgi:hypothetical protein
MPTRISTGFNWYRSFPAARPKVQQIARQKPDHPTVAVHFAANAALTCTDYRALRRRLAPKAVMEHKFNAIAWLEKIEFHPRHRRRPRDMIGRPSLLSGQPAIGSGVPGTYACKGRLTTGL